MSGIAVDAEAQEAEHAERGERERHHPGEDGPLDREIGEAHSSAPSRRRPAARPPRAARRRARPRSRRRRARRGRAAPRGRPARTSPRTSTRPASWTPVVTVTRFTRFVGADLEQHAPSLRWISASSGTITTPLRGATPRLTRANRPGRRCPSSLSISALIRSVRVAGIDGGRDERHHAVEDAVGECADRDVDAAGPGARARCRAR